MRLRVRQIGFEFVERMVDRAALAPPADTIAVALKRIPFVLPSVVTTATDRCEHEVDSLSKKAAAEEQVRHGRSKAERQLEDARQDKQQRELDAKRRLHEDE